MYSLAQGESILAEGSKDGVYANLYVKKASAYLPPVLKTMEGAEIMLICMSKRAELTCYQS